MSSELVIKYNPSSRHARGKACLNCRRRKIKCDGEHPMCGQCASARGTFDDCEYSFGQPSQAQLLEQKILEVQTRIDKLEKATRPALLEPSTPGSLHLYPLGGEQFIDEPFSQTIIHSTQPLGYGTSRLHNLGALGVVSRHETITPPISGTVYRAQASYVCLFLWLLDFLDGEWSRLNAFYSQCQHVGFFLEPERFYQSFLSPLPLGHVSRPTPALLNAIYLWGVHLSPSSPGIYDEYGFLRATLYHLPEDLSGSHPYKIIQTIQAEILLSYYYLKNSRLLEGSYHANAALSLSISAGLNRLHAPLQEINQGLSTSPHVGIPSDSSTESTVTSLPPPLDLIEESERIDAFWASVILNNCWVAIQESHSMLFDPLDAKVDTPWPTDSPYDAVLQYCGSGNTLQQFIECTTVEGVSIKALHAKATILLAQATTIHASGFKTDASHSKALIRLDFLIEQFKTMLPLSGSLNSLLSEREILALSRMIAHAATIRLHLPYVMSKEEAHDKCVSAAESIASITENMVPANSDDMQLDPIVAVLWIAACEVLMPEVLSMNSGDNGVLVAFETIMSRMTCFSEKHRMMKYLVEQFQRKYSARFKTPS